jgi:hypothetical protein
MAAIDLGLQRQALELGKGRLHFRGARIRAAAQSSAQTACWQQRAVAGSVARRLNSDNRAARE